MDNKYITLFKDLAQATASTAETVMEYDRQKNDEKGLETATIMRDDYQNLADKIATTADYVLDKADAAKMLVAAMIQVNQVQDRINNLKKAMTGYQTDVIPKLQEVVDAENDEAASKLANEKFIIENEN
jgi:hypothetical protein